MTKNRVGLRGYVQFNKYTYIQVSLIPPWEDQREWHRMTRMTRPDCAVMCNLINIHTYVHTYIHSKRTCEKNVEKKGLVQ